MVYLFFLVLFLDLFLNLLVDLLFLSLPVEAVPPQWRGPCPQNSNQKEKNSSVVNPLWNNMSKATKMVKQL